MLSRRLISASSLNIIAASSLAVFFTFDRLLKQVAATLPSGKAIEAIPGFLSFGFTTNYRIALSLPLEGAWLNYVISLIVLGVIYKLIKSINTGGRAGEILAWSAILLGASSNLYDRFRYGYVIDYLEISYLTALNIADLLISGGAIYLIIKGFRKK